ncbi:MULTISPECIES: hypothetical protein [Rhizobium]|jgi:hypothetical protein|uniref:Uncharacterized protein n=1 Tax=Rhizobium anhuiense TaxID=1184720 RepID=A0A432NGF5_9HYPH|nr:MULTISPECIES: hypothetical protein [Rhizobium]KZS51331.1 hypothetical protein AS890_04865 [Rhizobium anhuiense bv. trifolii]MBB3299741.1 hypothetical protein [Rhizobium sp. BK112]MBB3368991.1 hypothetical protein [Rhizobium sp. BK077]MBB3743766.1 hypothetical protein [Rhizobium sp. BK591]MBB4113484.1 hypothetical protein [Rhizobium sp. BK226]
MTKGNDRRETRGGEKREARARRFGIDHASGRLVLGSFSIGLPRSRIARMGLGVALILCGFLGFLPILGFWMLPLGFIVLSHDLPFARRLRRRLAVWWHRRGKPAG